MEIVQKLGGSVVLGTAFHPSVTHCVAPPGCHTEKSLGAALHHRWIAHPDVSRA
jgi:hypothetical protein